MTDRNVPFLPVLTPAEREARPLGIRFNPMHGMGIVDVDVLDENGSILSTASTDLIKLDDVLIDCYPLLIGDVTLHCEAFGKVDVTITTEGATWRFATTGYEIKQWRRIQVSLPVESREEWERGRGFWGQYQILAFQNRQHRARMLEEHLRSGGSTNQA